MYVYVCEYGIKVASYTGLHLKCHIADSSEVKLAVILTQCSFETSRVCALSSNCTQLKIFSTLPGGEIKHVKI